MNSLGQGSLEKPLDPRVAEYSVTEPMRREASGSKCKLFIVHSQNTSRVKQQQTGMAQARHNSNPRASVGLRSANNFQRA